MVNAHFRGARQDAQHILDCEHHDAEGLKPIEELSKRAPAVTQLAGSAHVGDLGRKSCGTEGTLREALRAHDEVEFTHILLLWLCILLLS